MEEYEFDDYYVKKFNIAKKGIIEFLDNTKTSQGGWLLPTGQTTLKPNQYLHVQLENTIEVWLGDNKKEIPRPENPQKESKSEPKITPQERYESVIFWKENVIPFVKKLVEEEIENEKKSGAEVGISEKLQMYESYLNLATEVYNSL